MASQQTMLHVEPDEGGLRIDRLLTRRLPTMNRAKIRHLFDMDRLRVNGHKPRGPALKLEAGDCVEIAEPQHGDPAAHLLHDEPSFFVAYKPAGVPMARALVASRPRGRRPGRPRAVLALERPVSGGVVGTREASALHRIARQFQAGRGSCRFTALVRCVLPRSTGPLPDAAGWTYRRLGRFRDHTLVELMPPPATEASALQALAVAGWPAVSLPGEAGRAEAIDASSLFFARPRTGRSMRFLPPLPPGFRVLLSGLPPAPTLAVDVPPKPPSSPGAPAREGPEPALRSPRTIVPSSPLRRRPKS